MLEILYEDSGPTQSPLVLRLRGWPDAPRGWSSSAHLLQADGFQTNPTVIEFLKDKSCMI